MERLVAWSGGKWMLGLIGGTIGKLNSAPACPSHIGKCAEERILLDARRYY